MILPTDYLQLTDASGRPVILRRSDVVAIFEGRSDGPTRPTVVSLGAAGNFAVQESPGYVFERLTANVAN